MPTSDPRLRPITRRAYVNLIQRHGKKPTPKPLMKETQRLVEQDYPSEVDEIMNSHRFFEEWNKYEAPEDNIVQRQIAQRAATQEAIDQAYKSNRENQEWDLASKYMTPLKLLRDMKMFCLCIGEPFTHLQAKWVERLAPMLEDQLLPEELYQIAKWYADRENRWTASGRPLEDLFVKDLDNYVFALQAGERLRTVMGRHHAVKLSVQYPNTEGPDPSWRDTEIGRAVAITTSLQDQQDIFRLNDAVDLFDEPTLLFFFDDMGGHYNIHQGIDPLQIVIRKLIPRASQRREFLEGLPQSVQHPYFMDDESKRLASYVLTQLTKGSRWQFIGVVGRKTVIHAILRWVQNEPEEDWLAHYMPPLRQLEICGVETFAINRYQFSNFEEDENLRDILAHQIMPGT